MSTTDKTELRKFGLIMAAVICGLFGLFIPWLINGEFKPWPWILGGLFLVPVLLFPTALRPVHYFWMTFGHVMGWINTRLILGLVFYIVFLPAGLTMKLMGKDPLQRTLSPTALSYRKNREYTIKPEDMEKPF